MRVVIALESRGHLGLADHGTELARRRRRPLEIIGGRARAPWMLHCVPVSVVTLRAEIDREADALLMEAIAMVPPDVAVRARLVDGRAWTEIERIARSPRRWGRSPSLPGGGALVLEL